MATEEGVPANAADEEQAVSAEEVRGKEKLAKAMESCPLALEQERLAREKADEERYEEESRKDGQEEHDRRALEFAVDGNVAGRWEAGKTHLLFLASRDRDLDIASVVLDLQFRHQ